MAIRRALATHSMADLPERSVCWIHGLPARNSRIGQSTDEETPGASHDGRLSVRSDTTQGHQCEMDQLLAQVPIWYEGMMVLSRPGIGPKEGYSRG